MQALRDVPTPAGETPPTKLDVEDLSFYYGRFRALNRINLKIPEQRITALIGPSGCGKSTLLRVFNRMYDLVPGARAEGRVRLGEEDILKTRGLLELRQRVGMVFQRPSPFPLSIRDNVAFAPRLLGWSRQDVDQAVERSLKDAALWDEVKDRLKAPAVALSGGQQQRLSIARCLAVRPEVILMDEPCSALDPISTSAVEDLIHSLKDEYTIVIVTHNMQQAARVSEDTAFFNLAGAGKPGRLIEFNPTKKIFSVPDEPATEAYISGRFG